MAGDTPIGPCRQYEGTVNAAGYGVLPKPVNGSRLAHRAVLAEALGRPVEGFALHHCDNPPCVEPAHLYEGSARDNMADARRRGRARGGKGGQTKCKHGHDLTLAENVQLCQRITRLGTTITARRCLPCRRRTNRGYL